MAGGRPACIAQMRNDSHEPRRTRDGYPGFPPGSTPQAVDDMTAPAIPDRSPRASRRRTLHTLLAVLLLVALLAPVGYLFGQLWTSTGNAIDGAASGRAAVAYGRPLNNLLVALVDARATAVRGAAVDAVSLRAAIGEVDAVNRR